MPFQAACPFCPTRIKLSHRSVGRSVRCPQCGNYFTAVPPEELPTANAPSLRAAAARPVNTTAAVAESPRLASTDDAPPNATSGLPESTPVGPAVPAPASSWTAIPAWVNVWGVAGFFLGSLSLLLASADYLRYLTIPLASVAVFVIVLGCLVGMGEHRLEDMAWLSLGGMVSAGVLGVALLQPRWLNSGWDMNAAVPQADPNQQLLVSPDNRVVKKSLTESDWVDAGSGSIRMGDLHVRIENIKVDVPVQTTGTAASPASRRLLITITLANTGHVRTFSYAGQWTGKNMPALRDNQGRFYLLREGTGKAHVGQIVRAVLRPVTHMEDVLAFDLPGPDIEYLELEIPAAAWMGQGMCRFRIPRAMIVWPAKS